MRVAVLGGGLQGSCVAMELASAGVSVDLYDKNDRCMSQASLQNEGKIHLGYVYANDRSLCTARTMVQGAIAFAPLMRRWIGGAIDDIPTSAPFHYVIHNDSLLTVDEVEHHFRRSHAAALEEGRGMPLDYFGADYRRPPERLSERECGALFDRTSVSAAYSTSEMSVDPEALADAIRCRLSGEPDIKCLLRARVHGVAVTGQGGIVDFEVAGVRAKEGYDHVVNALWDGRLAVDETVGVKPDRPWLYRLKHYVRLQAPDISPLPSVTIVLGPFGDIVSYGNGHVFLSWYPAGMTAVSSELSPPAWPATLDRNTSSEMQRNILNGLRKVIPSVGRLTSGSVKVCHVKGGIIFAWGRTGIHDPSSELHERYAIGPRSYGRYHSVDTGKLTTAPLFAKRVAARICHAR